MDMEKFLADVKRKVSELTPKEIEHLREVYHNEPDYSDENIILPTDTTDIEEE